MKFKKLKPIAAAVLLSTYGATPYFNVAVAQVAVEQNEATFSSENTIVLEEIVVTARGRTESIQTVPISETVFTAQTIKDAGIDQVDDFLSLTPGVTFANSQDAGTNFISIRGLSQVRNGEAPVAVVVDGVLQTNSRTFDQPLFDVSSIEVLRGPQGALYGRNATGGAILIETKAPTQETEGYVQVGAGDGSEFTAEGSISGALSRNVTGRISARYKDSDGLLDNFVTGEEVDYVDEIAIRGHLNFKISDTVTADLRASIVETEGGALNFSYQPAIVDRATGLPSAFDFSIADADLVERDFSANNVGQDNRDAEQLSLRVNVDLGFGTFRSVTAYDNIDQASFGDQFPYSRATQITPATAFPFFDGIQSQAVEVETFSQEFRLTSNDDQAFRWLVGAYYLDTDRFISSSIYDDLESGLPNIAVRDPIFNPLAPLTSFIADDNDNEAYALFFNLEYDVNDRFEVAFAGRYDNDERSQVVDSRQGNYVDGVLVSAIGVPGSENNAEFDSFQPKVTLRYEASDSLNLYGSWGEGFRSGQFNQNGVGAVAAQAGVVGVTDVIDQEETSTTELGIKKTWADGRYSLNGSIYNTSVENAPYFVFIGAVGAQVLVPIDDIDVTGGELEFNAAVSDSLDFYASVSITDSEIEEYFVNPSAVGNDAPYIADSTFNIGLQYRTAISSNINLFARGDFELRGEQFWDPENTTSRDDVSLANFRLGIEDAEGKWSLTASIDNAFDEIYNAEWVSGGFAHAATPRVWRVQGRYNF